MTLRQTIDVLSWLTPSDLTDAQKRRVGATNDGGYVLVDELSGNRTVFSYGLSWNILFELELAELGHMIFMFDHTIPALTIEHPRFRWQREGLADRSPPGADLASLGAHVDRFAPDISGMILKLDVEGAEWGALDEAPRELLQRFDQIVIEFHDFRLIDDQDWSRRSGRVLAKLARDFTVHHVHANNCAPVVMAGGRLPVADVIEVSYVRSGLTRHRPSSALFPTSLDAPNDPLRPEILLLFYPFMPISRARGITPEFIRLYADRADAALKPAPAVG